MTVKRRNHGRGHSYYVDGEKYPGVTTLLGNGMPKPGLMKWAGEYPAEYAVDHWDELSLLKPSKRLKEIVTARFKDRDAAANRGTKVHDLAERLIAGEEVEVPEELEGHVESCVKFLNEWRVKPIAVEFTVANRRWRYCGSVDLVGEIDGEIAIGDYKTSRSGIYGETALQLAAYANAEVWVDQDGDERPMADLGIRRGYGIWIRADGYDVIPLPIGDEPFKFFTHVAWIARHMDDLTEYVGPALETPVLEGTPA